MYICVNSGCMRTERFVTEHYFKLLKEQEVKFIFDHAEKMLRETLETNTLIVTRVTSLTTLTSTLLIALFGFTISRFDANKIDTLFITAVVGIVYFFAIAVMLFLNILPKKYHQVGAEPKQFFSRAFINRYNANYRIQLFYVNEIQEYQKRIQYNLKLNYKRWNLYLISLTLILLAPVVLSLVYYILSLPEP